MDPWAAEEFPDLPAGCQRCSCWLREKCALGLLAIVLLETLHGQGGCSMCYWRQSGYPRLSGKWAVFLADWAQWWIYRALLPQKGAAEVRRDGSALIKLPVLLMSLWTQSLFFASSNLNNKMQREKEGVSVLNYSQCCWQYLDEKVVVWWMAMMQRYMVISSWNRQSKDCTWLVWRWLHQELVRHTTQFCPTQILFVLNSAVGSTIHANTLARAAFTCWSGSAHHAACSWSGPRVHKQRWACLVLSRAVRGGAAFLSPFPWPCSLCPWWSVTVCALWTGNHTTVWRWVHFSNLTEIFFQIQTSFWQAEIIYTSLFKHP